MKPPPFVYHRATSVEDALAALDTAGAGGKVLAGGQSLIPLLNMRLAAPETLVDINAVDELATIEADATEVRVGARVRHAELEHHHGAARACPLLGQALAHVAHPVIRNRGTVVGSIAHADPAGELTAVLALLDGRVEIASRQGTRTVEAGEFFLAPLVADLAPGELVVGVGFPSLPASAGSAFVEVARRHGDYALCGVAAVVDVAEGAVSSARLGVISVHPTPLVVDVTAELAGQPVTAIDAAAAADHLTARIEPEADIHASAAYRRHLARVLAGRALAQAAEHAGVRETAHA